MDQARAALGATGRPAHDADVVRLDRPATSRVRIVRRRALDRLVVVTPEAGPSLEAAWTPTTVARGRDAAREQS